MREVSGQTRDLTLAFDGGEWQWADDRGSRTLSPSAYGHVRWEMRGRGAVLRPAAGATLTVAAPFEGEGGIVVDGEGTVSFTDGAYAFAGVSDVRKGTLDLSSAGNLTGASFAGDGTVKGARVDAAVLCAKLSDSWENTNGVPVLLDCEFIGTVTVSAGRAADDRLQLPSDLRATPIAKIAGSTRIDLSRWMLEKKAAHDATGVFTLDGDTVYLTPCNLPGLVMIVR